jgi:hypothetical protein
MKAFVTLAAALAFTLPAAAQQLYKYVDKDGRTVYSDQPPPNVASKAIAAPPPPPTTAPAAAKSAVERDKELEKARKEARDKADKSEKMAKSAEDKERACAQAKTAYNTFSEGGRIYKLDDKGERVFMDDAEMEVEKGRARAAMDEACRKG